MNKKSLFATVIIVPSLAIGSFWIYQATLFEKSFTQQISQVQETLKNYGVTFKYDDMQISPYMFRARLVNPTISGVIPKLSDIQKDAKGLEGLDKIAGSIGTLTMKGDIIARFSPIANTITILSETDTQMNVQGPIDFDLTAPKPAASQMVIYRKDYDIFGKHPFLSLHNIKAISSDVKGIQLLLNGQKLISMKEGTSQISIDRDSKDLDVTLDSDVRQIEFFKVEKGIKGTLKEVEVLNLALIGAFARHSVLGPEDQKISAKLHINDFLNYFEELQKTFANNSGKDNPQIWEKYFPEGIKLEVSDYSLTNKVYQSKAIMEVGRSKDIIPLKLKWNIKFTDQWPKYWEYYADSIIQYVNQLANMNQTNDQSQGDVSAVLSTLAKTCMPQLQSFGDILLSLDMQIPKDELTTGKGSFDFKSDLYDISGAGSLKGQEGSITIKTRNALPLMADLESYVNRIALPFLQGNAAGAQNLQGIIKGSRAVLEKILEPSGAVQQSINVKMNHEGLKVGNYDFMQILALFGAGMASAAPVAQMPAPNAALNPTP